MTAKLWKIIEISGSAIFLLVVIWFIGHRQLGGFDMSALVDTGWRIASGQKPYLDFPLTTPISFYMGAALAIKLWGANWSAFVLAAMGIGVLAFLAQVYLLTRIISWKYSLFIALVCQILCIVVTSYWWYNAVTVSAACLFFTAAYVYAKQPHTRTSTFALWSTLTFLSTTKPNIAGLAIIFILAILLWFIPNRIRVLLIYLASLISFFILLFVLSINPLDIFRSYLELAQGRGLPAISWFFNDKPYEYLVTIPLLLLSLLPLLTKISHLESIRQTLVKQKVLFAITVAIFLSGLYSMFTNSDSNLVVGVPFFVLGSFVFSQFLPSDSELDFPRDLSLVTTFISLLVLVFGCVNIDGSKPKTLVILWYMGMIVCGIFTLSMLFGRKNPHQLSKIAKFPNWSFNNLFWIALLACGIVGLYAGAMRWRVFYTGPELFYTRSPLVEIRDTPFFKDSWVSSSAQEVVTEINTVLIEKFHEPKNWQNASIFFGPRIEISYAAFGVASPKNLPIWWHPNNSYSDIYTDEIIQSFFSHKFKVCIFLRLLNQPETTFLPNQIVDDLNVNYERVDYNNIVVFYRK